MGYKPSIVAGIYGLLQSESMSLLEGSSITYQGRRMLPSEAFPLLVHGEVDDFHFILGEESYIRGVEGKVRLSGPNGELSALLAKLELVFAEFDKPPS